MKNLIHNLASTANIADLAALSSKNYHAKGLHYLNLLRTDRLTIKLYIIQPNAERTAEGWLVNPHSHRYNFETYVLAGHVRHAIFLRSERGTAWNEFEYQAAPQGGNGKFVLGSALSLTSRVQTFKRGDSYYLDTSEVHTIDTSHSDTTILLLNQFKDQLNPQTQFFSRLSSPPSLDGLYQPMSEQEYRNTLDLVFYTIRENL